MELKDVVSVSGLPGIHKILGQNKNGLILESLADGKKFSTNLRQKVSILSDISIYEEEGEVKLLEVLKNIKSHEEAGNAIPVAKIDNDAARDFLGSVLPKFDRERVYPSDINKLISWYHLLKDTLDFDAVDEEVVEGGDVKTAKSEEKPKKITAAKNTKQAKTVSGAKSKPSAPRKMGS